MIDYRNFYYTPEQMLQYAGFKKCKKCGGNVLIVNDGEYKCEECGEIYQSRQKKTPTSKIVRF